MKKILTLGVILIGLFIGNVGAQTYTYEVSYGNSVTLTAFPNEGWEFTEWTNTSTGDVVGTTNPWTTPNISADVQYNANFRQIVLSIQVAMQDVPGTLISGAGEFLWGDVISLEVQPDIGYQFDYWAIVEIIGIENDIPIFEIIEIISTENPHIFTMNLAQSESWLVRPYLKPSTYTITIDVVPAGTGTVEGVINE